jgi:hypothetical protein
MGLNKTRRYQEEAQADALEVEARLFAQLGGEGFQVLGELLA